MTASDTDHFLQFAEETLLEAGHIALRYFRQPVQVESKRGLDEFDPVTAADREIETLIRNRIQTAYPGHAILGEEYDPEPGLEPYRWVIDPLDGTRAFVSGSPLWGILLGLQHQGRPVLGLMYQPFLNEMFIGEGNRAWYVRDGRSRRISTTQTSSLSDALLYCTHPSIFSDASDLKKFLEVAGCCRMMRYGGDCYSYCLLAHGLIDLVIEGGLNPYDIIPLIPLIEAAGGVVTDWEGGEATSGGRVIAAATPELHAGAVAMLSRTTT